MGITKSCVYDGTRYWSLLGAASGHGDPREGEVQEECGGGLWNLRDTGELEAY